MAEGVKTDIPSTALADQLLHNFWAQVMDNGKLRRDGAQLTPPLAVRILRCRTLRVVTRDAARIVAESSCARVQL